MSQPIDTMRSLPHTLPTARPRSSALALCVLLACTGCPGDDTSTPPAPDMSAVGDMMQPDEDSGGSADLDAGRPPDDTGVSDDTGAGMDAGPPEDGGMSMLEDPGSGGGVAAETSSAEATIDGTTIPLTIYLPQTPGPHPVVLFQHGAELSPTLYASYGTHLASWEYVVVMPAMPGPLSDGATHVELAALTVGVLDWIEAEAGAGAALDGRADTSKIVLAGHSLGGKISMLVAADDDRPVAVFGIDPVDSQPPSLQPNAYPSVAPERMGDITIPIGLVGETVNATCDGLFCQPCAPADENFEQYYAAATSPALSIEVLGANHVSFLDDPDCGSFCSICDDGTDTPATTRMLTRRYMTAFLELVVRGEAAAKTWIVGAEIDEDVAADRVTYESKNGLSALP